MIKHLSFIKASLLMTLIVSVLACGQEAPVSEDGVFGAGIKNENHVDYKTLMAEMAVKDTVEATILATVSEVCQAKGCWMTLHEPGQADGTEIMVRFKDYGFFVPKDIGGYKVIVEGKAFKSVIGVDELRHYAEDAGKSKEEIEQINEPENSFSFEATGVRVLEKS